MKRSIKELWIRFKNREEYEERKDELYSLLGRACGDSPVRVYLEDCKSVARIPKYFDERQTGILTSAFGGENIVIKEKKEDVTSSRGVQEYYGDIFGRIADSLEGIEAALKEISNHFRE